MRSLVAKADDALQSTPTVDTGHLRRHYGSLEDQELLRLWRGELIPEARSILEAEMSSRGVSVAQDLVAEAPAPIQSRNSSGVSNPYRPPGALVADPAGLAAVVKVRGLIRLFQTMVITSTLIGLFLFASPLLPLPISGQMAALRGYSGAGAIAFSITNFVFLIAQPLWLLSAIGLCFLKWWARPLFVGTYALTTVASLFGGIAVSLPWESSLATITTLIDGAVLALAFLPPLSEYFARDRG
jgi:hypothetical protein